MIDIGIKRESLNEMKYRSDNDLQQKAILYRTSVIFRNEIQNNDTAYFFEQIVHLLLSLQYAGGKRKFKINRWLTDDSSAGKYVVLWKHV